MRPRKPPRIDLIALDLDGTLLDERDGVSPANRQAIRAALELGVRVVLVTGRGADAPARLVRELKLNLPAICAHGALTRDFLAGRTLGHIPVPYALARPLIEHAERHRLNAAIYFDERFLCLTGTTIYMDDQRRMHWAEVPSLLEAVHAAPTFIRFLGSHAVESVRAAFPDLPVHFKFESWGRLRRARDHQPRCDEGTRAAAAVRRFPDSAGARTRSRRLAQRRADAAVGRDRPRDGQRAAGGSRSGRLASQRPARTTALQRRSRRTSSTRREREERVMQPDPTHRNTRRACAICSPTAIGQGCASSRARRTKSPTTSTTKDEHFWEVLMHKLICNRLDMLAQHETSRAWLAQRGYTPDIAGY